MKGKVLFIDDDVRILDGYRRVLRGLYDISVASTCKEALLIIMNNGPFEVVVCDMKMPDLNGIKFLAVLKERHPDIVRVMLTGNQNQKIAVSAINNGDIFRFLNKPCEKELMEKTLDAAIKYHKQLAAEHELLENTLKSCVEAMLDVLSMMSPNIFGRLERIRQLVRLYTEALERAPSWEFDTVVMLSQLGFVTLSDTLKQKVQEKEPLEEEESSLVGRHPLIAAELIGKIPRMESVAEGIKYQNKNFDGSGSPDDTVNGDDIPLISRLLRILLDFDDLETSGVSVEEAIEKMSQRKGAYYDPNLMDLLPKVLGERVVTELIDVPVANLEEDMVIGQDVVTDTGILLVCRGQKASVSIAERLMHFESLGSIENSVLVEHYCTVTQANGVPNEPSNEASDEPPN